MRWNPLLIANKKNLKPYPSNNNDNNTFNTWSSGFSTFYVSAVLKHGQLVIEMIAPEETIDVSLP